MPIYAYRCSACGHAQDVLQKISDPVLTVCPACGESTYAKQVTAAGFQLKGSGWYVTDFRDGGKAAKAAGKDADKASAKEVTDGGKPAGQADDKSVTAGKPAGEKAVADKPAAASQPAPSTTGGTGA
ncbi:MAG TPA: zinc ribbon domain-containing protein [Rubrivivax sp.]|jgi:putative FmdB family regulatory protein|nr:zinc ribbon domain-containing protein [Rhodoferax sp.]MCL4737977.1 zinc ribbon domain-containing protein [Burkholderiaceae bacterium]MCP5287668.1 zinc ribbon domain-containing protein [Burkholderiaceae bacterium]HMQ73320.1 zinc ribbon domain-containing protein [Rubrivivax sp.]HMR70404.1 zinc ribbon domain-containing protein [Rubrivivax sp.]